MTRSSILGLAAAVVCGVTAWSTVRAQDAPAALYVADDGRVRWPVPPRTPATELCWSRDSRVVAVTGGGATVVARPNGEVVRRFEDARGATTAEADDELWIAFPDHLERWRFDDGKTKRIQEQPFPDGWRLVARPPVLVRVASRTETVLRLPDGRFVSGDLAAAGKPFATETRVFDPLEATVQRFVAKDLSSRLGPARMAVAPDGARIALAMAVRVPSCLEPPPETPVLLTSATGEIVSSIREMSTEVSLAWSPSGDRLAVSDHLTDLRIYGAEAGEPVRSDAVSGARWAAFVDADTLLTHDGNDLRLQRLPELAVIASHDSVVRDFVRQAGAAIHAAALAPDRRHVALAAGMEVGCFEVMIGER